MKVINSKGGVKARSVNDRAIEHSISQKTELSKKNERELTGKAERAVHQADRNAQKAETRNGAVPNRPIPAQQKKNGVAFEKPQHGETSSTADSNSVFEQRHIGAQRENGQPSGSKTAATADGKTLSPKTPSAEVGKKIQNKSQTGIKTAETAAEKTTPTQFRPPKQFNLSPSQPKNKGYKVLKNGTVDNGGITKKKERVIYSRQQTQQLQNAKPKKIDKVVFLKSQTKKENRPLLFSLTSLQIAANEELGYTAAQTLNTMQSLYEKKLLTYPRTDSNYLTDDMAAILPERVRMLRCFDDMSAAVDWLLADGLNIDSRIINNAKVSDHHAIIPTENIGNAANAELSDDEKAILDLVINRFLVALSPQHEYIETEYIFDVAGESFKCKTKTTKEMGWRRFVKPDKNEANRMLSYSEGEIITVGNISIVEGETKPPKRYTESSLLKAMENIDRRIVDKELSEYVSERGLGTPATRAAIIEKIISDNYAERKEKNLVVTDIGMKMIDFVPDEVKSIEMTATMELQLSAIQNGTVSADDVIKSITNRIVTIIEAEKKKPHTPVIKPKYEPKAPIGKCPKCGGNVYKFVRDNKAVYYCENSPKSCFFRVYEDDFFFSAKGKTLTEAMMKTMLTKGEVKVCGLISKDKTKTYDAFIFVSDKSRTDKNGSTKVCFDMRFPDKSKKGGK